MNTIKIVDDFEREFGDLIWSHSFDYQISESDLRKAHHIFNENIFESKLDESLNIVIVPYNGQRGKGSFRFGDPSGKGIELKQDFKFVQNSNDNFFKTICVLAHEMIHQYDFNFGPWSKSVDRLKLKTDLVNKKQYIGDYEIHDNPLFDHYMKLINSYGFNVQKLYSLKDKTFMKKIIEAIEVDDYDFFEQIDEVEHDDKPMSINQAKTMYNSLKSDDDINMVVKPNGAWMIEVF